ncbi:sigma-54 dependent transcriptional regulator [Flavobacterium sp. DG1-102-2]|uniref:sigma-54-dependent transcriptional regulator n=1 Tax=Flavobacterium sp. DG1-102-2 TaxID=3081663 RepID=UPI002949C704|nr:sigma-54 dependent transcriptional regulator [Flavobacterium sp. DG1-102-2]MDV6167398.1 sigma-54 dependent transcriptional regulator [Flavobacterium sp. DG1-102-2]
MKKKILLIDDEEKLRSLMARIITLEGFEVIQAADCKAGLKKLQHEVIDIVLCDVKLPDGNGVDLTLTVKQAYPHIEIILLTAYGNIPDGIQAIKNGAFDYIVKGDDNNKIIPLIHRAIEKAGLQKRVDILEAKLEKKYSFEGIIGKSKNIGEAISLAQKVAPTDTTVLLTGETGTGKEVFANAIHQNSARKNKNFVAINCSAFSHDLLESEMFGHAAGAFTGAIKDKKGLFEEANNGTIFLDEVGEMPIDLQAKLLRVIEVGEFIKVGESKVTKIDLRIVAATNRNLTKEIEAGNFRQDLYYRLSIFSIYLPALRERLVDIEELSKFFLKSFSNKTNKKIHQLSAEYLHFLKLHNWPGNIRELKNVLERSVILENSNTLTIDSLPYEIQQLSDIKENEDGKMLSAFSLASAEKIHIQKVINYTNGNKTETAKLLNIALTTLYRKLEEYKIQ